MKTLVAGSSPVLDAAAAALYAELGAETGRIGHAREALAHPSNESTALVAPLVSQDDLALLPALAARGVSVVLLSDVAAVDLRFRALQDGAADVLFPPITAARIVAALDAREPVARTSLRFAGMKAVVHPKEGTPFAATCATVSTAGLELEVLDRRPAPGELLCAVLHAATPFIAYCRVQETLPLGVEGGRVFARFLALTADESGALVDLVDSLRPVPSDLAAILHVVDRLGVELALGPPELHGVRIPALLEVERAGLVSGDGAIGAAAVARVAAVLLGDVLERDPALAGLARAAAVVDAGANAQDGLRTLATIAETGDPARLAGLRDLQKRLANAVDRVQQLSGIAGKDAPVPRTLPPSHWERLSPRARQAVFGGLALGAGMLGLGIAQVISALRTSDPARVAVAASPEFEIRGIRAQSIEIAATNAKVVVDGSWFAATEEDRRGFALVARQAAGGAKTLEIQDVLGRPLARVDGKNVTLLDLPR